MPIEKEMDGVQLDRLTPGRVCDVSSSLGSWLLAEEYAELEMRSAGREERDFFTPAPNERKSSSIDGAPHQLANDRRRRTR